MTPLVQPSGVLPGGLIEVRDFPAERTPWIELGWPGIEAVCESLDILGVDSSGSVTAPVGSDPVGNRFAEAEKAIRLVSDWTLTSRSKVAVLHFDHPHGASGVVPLTHRHLMRQLRPSLRVPSGAQGTSDLLPMLLEAEKLAAAHPGHDIRFTVFSDFELTDSDPTEVLSRLLAFPGTIHAVVLGGNPPPDLIGADNVTVTPISPGDPPGAFAAAIHRSLTATRRGARYSVLHQGRTRGKWS